MSSQQVQRVRVQSPNVTYGDESIESTYAYDSVRSSLQPDGTAVVEPRTTRVQFRTATQVPKLGVMLVGLGGNNGSTVVASTVANREGICWRTARGVQTPNYFGSLTQATTVRIGADKFGEDVHVPFSSMLPMVHPNDIVFSGWDINSMNLADAMERAQVLDYDLQRQLRPHLKDMVPLPSIYRPDFIAANQSDRADNVLTGTLKEQIERVRTDIREFKAANGLDQVIVLWTANTERFAEIREGLNDTAANLLAAIERDDSEVSPSTAFAVASIQEGCVYINGSPQNTFVPGCIELAQEHNVLIAGDDFKSGQTKFKSVMVDFLISAGLAPRSIVSYNHLGNNDGKNLSAPQTFRSKEISKSNVVDDMVASNNILYKDGVAPDHCVVIKYVPYVSDSKRALDEYVSEIFMGGLNTISLHNTCEDSLLASPIILDLVILAELFGRVELKLEDAEEYERFHAVLSILSFLLKAPLVPAKTPVINAFFKQRNAITNTMRALIGLPPENDILLEHRVQSAGSPLPSQPHGVTV